MVPSLKKLSADELVPGGSGYDHFLPEIPEQIHFCPEGHLYVFKNILQVKDNLSGKIVWEFSLSTLNQLLGSEKLKHLDKFPELHFLHTKEHCCWILVQQKIVFINYRTKEIRHVIRIKKEYKNIDFNEQKGLFAYTDKNGLYLLSMEGKVFPVFVDKKATITAGQAASRNEFGIHKGTFWSPQGAMLAFYKTDESHVANYPLVRMEDPVASLQKIEYPMVGKKSQRVRIGIYIVDKNEVFFLQPPDEEEAYLPCITWSPDEKNIYLAELGRSQKECKIKCYSSINGTLEKTLFSEKDEKYTEPQNPLFFPDDSGCFIWQSRRDGFNHLYLYDKNGNLLRQLTKGDWEVTELAGFNKKSRQLIFLSTTLSPLNRNAYAVHIDSGDVILLTPEDGIHRIVISEDHSLFIDSFSSINIPGEVFLRSLPDGKIIRTLQRAPNPYRDYSIPKIEIGTIHPKKDAPELYYRIVRPEKLIPKKKYPLLFYVYGGPHIQLIRNEWLAGTKGFEYLMANEGYIVFSIDPRGSANRGKAFEEAIWKNIGKAQLEDYRFAMQWIVSEKNYINTSQTGVYGWSFGGFMATSLMLKAPELFRAGVAGGAVIDWSFYEAMYTERYMETPTENVDGYRENNLRNFIGKLEGELLLIHCDNDPVVLWQNTLSFLQKSIQAKKQIDYFVYPGYAHNVQGPDRVHLMLKIKRYFDEKLLHVSR